MYFINKKYFIRIVYNKMRGIAFVIAHDAKASPPIPEAIRRML